MELYFWAFGILMFLMYNFLFWNMKTTMQFKRKYAMKNCILLLIATLTAAYNSNTRILVAGSALTCIVVLFYVCLITNTGRR